MKHCVCIVAVALFGFLAVGATLNVPSDYATIQEAVDAAKSGDVILVAPGVYEETVKLINKSNVTLKGDVEVTVPEDSECCGRTIGEAVNQVVIRGQIFVINSSGITLERLTVTGPGNGITVQGNVTSPVKDLTIRYCNVVRNDRDGIVLIGHYKGVTVSCSNVSYNDEDGIDVRDWGSDVTIEDSCVNYNGQYTATGVGIRVSAHAKVVVIRRNCIEGNAFAGIHPG